MNFKIKSDYKPTGDQPEAIDALLKGIKEGDEHQTLLGVTGSGKTFTVANVVAQINRPTLVLAHNKTLAAQLYHEFKSFFPDNAVCYFVSYYDYYQPEAYIPATGTYIEKDLSINEEIECLRIETTTALLSGRNDVLVVASVSCLYGMGNPSEFQKNSVTIACDMTIGRNNFLQKLVMGLYARTGEDIKSGTFRVRGDVVTIYPPYTQDHYRVHFFGDEIEKIESYDSEHKIVVARLDNLTIYPANLFVTSKDVLQDAIKNIQDDLTKQVAYFKEVGKHQEAKRLLERTEFDLEMIKELGYCSGIENYARYLDGREAGTRPFCLLDYFPKNHLMVIDESHVTIPQVHAMYGGDRSRKENLVNFGFRLPAAMDNRPLKFEEFEAIQNQVIYVSATPADYELEKSHGAFISQIIRPTGLLDPTIAVHPTEFQIDHLLEEIQQRIEKDQRILVTTLTKRMAEELSRYFSKVRVRCRYIHSDVDTLERVAILEDLRIGRFDVLIGVNLLREGLDLPEVSLVAVLDADKEGFLRSHRSLIQTIGRAARHLEGKAILYADKMTNSMKSAIEATESRREKQMAYNQKHGITPKALNKKFKKPIYGKEEALIPVVREATMVYTSRSALEKDISKVQKAMEQAAKELDFINAARYRDEIKLLKKKRDAFG